MDVNPIKAAIAGLDFKNHADIRAAAALPEILDELADQVGESQPILVSGSNIKTINDTSILGEGNISIPQGEQGPQGPQGIQGPQGPQGIQGPQGNTGSSVDYPYVLVNNLTTDDATKGLSAAQGVVLEGEINQLGQEVTGGEVPLDLSVLTQYSGVISGGTWDAVDSAVYKHIFLPVSPGEVYTIKAQNGYGTTIAALTQQDLSPTGGSTPSYCDACYQINISANNESQLTVPADCNYIYITSLYDNVSRLPTVSRVYRSLAEIARPTELGLTARYYTGCLKSSTGVISGSGTWDAVDAPSYQHIFVPVAPGDTITLVNNTTQSTNFVPVTQIDDNPTQGAAASICAGSQRASILSGESVTITAPNDCNYIYILKLYDNTDSEPEFYITVHGSIDNRFNNLSESLDNVGEKIATLQDYQLNSYITGNGNTFASQKVYGLKPGYTYRVILQNADWDKSGVTAANVYLWQIANLYNGVESILAYVFTDGQGNPGTVADYYDFTVPSNSDYIRVGLRAADGAIVNFMIVSAPTLKEFNDSFNSQLHAGLSGWAIPCARFSALMSGDEQNNIAAVENCDAFLFFTDPHTQHTNPLWYNHFEDYLGQIQKIYNSTPTEFVLSGGDWLGDSDTPDEAAYKLGLVSKTCYTMLPKCYMLVGNHDTNYQGKKDASAATYTTLLPNIAIRNLWYYWNKNRAYYTIEARNTKFYCFDTGVEGQLLAAQNNYGYEQAQWFATELLSETAAHIAIALHIYYMTNGGSLQPLTSLLMQIASAYNSRSTITVESTPYNFSNATGRVEFVIAGHQHADYTYTYTSGDDSIPVIVTRDVGNGTSFPTDATFDLVFVDYDNRKITCVRVGSGNDREVNL